MKITTDLANAAAFMYVNNEALDAVAHDFRLDQQELQRVVEFLEDNPDLVEQALADYLELRNI